MGGRSGENSIRFISAAWYFRGKLDMCSAFSMLRKGVCGVQIITGAGLDAAGNDDHSGRSQKASATFDRRHEHELSLAPGPRLSRRRERNGKWRRRDPSRMRCGSYTYLIRKGCIRRTGCCFRQGISGSGRTAKWKQCRCEAVNREREPNTSLSGILCLASEHSLSR